MTIQLDVKALLKLIELAGGEQFVLELRKSVMQAALEKYAKGTIDQATMTVMKEHINKVILEQVGRPSSWSTNFHMSPQLKKGVDKAIQDQAHGMNHEFIKKARQIADEAIKAVDIENVVKTRIDSAIRMEIDKQVKARLTQVMEQL